ncbi:MAG: 4Fe-4S dicluster domain-containing protein [Caldilineae bacterium]|nr:MAG: 4Fe-4S dicluster domain-containing protein [Caldilineae bacterium]
MSLFIRIDIDHDRCPGESCRACIDICPVDIFSWQDGRVQVVNEQEDECTLCALCLQQCPTEAITIWRLYARQPLPREGLHG